MVVGFITGGALAVLLTTTPLAPQSGAPKVLRNGTDWVTFLRFSPDGRYLARICQIGPVAIFDTASYRSLADHWSLSIPSPPSPAAR